MKKKRKSFLRWQGKKVVDGEISTPTQITTIHTLSEDCDVGLSKQPTETTTSSTPTSSMSVMPNEAEKATNIVSPEKESDDYSVYIVHEYVKGEITYGTRVAKESLPDRANRASTLSCLDASTQPCSTLLEQVSSFIPTEVRSFKSNNSNKSKVDNSLQDDEVSVISFDTMLNFRDNIEDDFVENSSFATLDVGNRCTTAKQRMIENITSVRCAHNARGCEMKLRDDDSSYVTVDEDEWEREFGQRGCCFTQQMHGIVMETGKAVYDIVGEPEDYPFGGRLVSAVRKCSEVE